MPYQAAYLILNAWPAVEARIDGTIVFLVQPSTSATLLDDGQSVTYPDTLSTAHR